MVVASSPEFEFKNKFVCHSVIKVGSGRANTTYMHKYNGENKSHNQSRVASNMKERQTINCPLNWPQKILVLK